MTFPTDWQPKRTLPYGFDCDVLLTDGSIIRRVTPYSHGDVYYRRFNVSFSEEMIEAWSNQYEEE